MGRRRPAPTVKGKLKKCSDSLRYHNGRGKKKPWRKKTTTRPGQSVKKQGLINEWFWREGGPWNRSESKPLQKRGGKKGKTAFVSQHMWAYHRERGPRTAKEIRNHYQARQERGLGSTSLSIRRSPYEKEGRLTTRACGSRGVRGHWKKKRGPTSTECAFPKQTAFGKRGSPGVHSADPTGSKGTQ